MDEAMIWKVLGGTGGLGGVVLLARMVYVQWMKQNPGLEQAGAGAEIYKMIKTEMMTLKEERDLLKKQVLLLEHLCLKAGLDVHEMYQRAGLMDTQENDDNDSKIPGQ